MRKILSFLSNLFSKQNNTKTLIFFLPQRLDEILYDIHKHTGFSKSQLLVENALKEVNKDLFRLLCKKAAGDLRMDSDRQLNHENKMVLKKELNCTPEEFTAIETGIFPKNSHAIFEVELESDVFDAIDDLSSFNNLTMSQQFVISLNKALRSHEDFSKNFKKNYSEELQQLASKNIRIHSCIAEGKNLEAIKDILKENEQKEKELNLTG